MREMTNRQTQTRQQLRTESKGKFVEITMETPISALNRFFDWQSAAIGSERDENGTLKPVVVVTEAVLLTWMLSEQKV